MKEIFRPVYKRLGMRWAILMSYSLLLVIIICLIVVFSHIALKNILVYQTSRNLDGVISNINKNIEYTLKGYDVLLNNLCANAAVKEYMEKKPENNYERYLIADKLNANILPLQSFYADIISIQLMTADNTMPLDNRGVFTEAHKAELFKTMEKKPFYYTDWDYVGGETLLNQYNDLMIISKQIRSDYDRHIGIGSVVFTTSEIISLVEKIEFNEYISVFLSDDKGKILFERNNLNYDADKLNEINIKSGGAQTLTSGGNKLYLYQNDDNRAGLSIKVLVSENYLLAPTNQVSLYILLISLIFILIAFVVNYYLSKNITMGVKSLVSKINSAFEESFKLQIDLNREWNKDDYGNDEISYLNEKLEAMAEKLTVLVKEAYESKIKLRESELRALQAQINPHFLHNTLSSINWLAINNGAADISEAVSALGKYYRLTLNKGKDIISLNDEVEQVKAYINIQKIRFQNAFTVDYDIQPSILDYYIPKMVLQPIVENAILHAFSGIDYIGHILIRILENADKKHIILSIKDNGTGFNISEPKLKNHDFGSGYGIKNVDEKIKLIFGNEFGVSIKSAEKQGTDVEIIIPKTDGGGGMGNA